MIKIQKRAALLLSGLVIVTLLLPLFLLLSLHFIRLAQLNEITNNGCDSGRFSKIYLTEQEYQQYIEGDNELDYRQVMYDIKSIARQGGGYLITVLADTKETGINELNKVLQDRNQAQSNAACFIFTFLYFENINTLYIPDHHFKSSPLKPVALIEYFCLQEVPTPPPDVFVNA